MTEVNDCTAITKLKGNKIMRIAIKVRLKKGILDPQGKTVRQALEHLGYNNLTEVRVGKLIEMDVNNVTDEEEALRIGKEVADRLLANPVMETYEVEIVD